MKSAELKKLKKDELIALAKKHKIDIKDKSMDEVIKLLSKVKDEPSNDEKEGKNDPSNDEKEGKSNPPKGGKPKEEKPAEGAMVSIKFAHLANKVFDMNGVRIKLDGKGKVSVPAEGSEKVVAFLRQALEDLTK